MSRMAVKACLLLIGLCSYAVLLTKADTFYSCPVVDSDVAGVCSEECSSHADCDGESRCCSNGCGHACATPIEVPYHLPPLVCPEIADDVAGICTEACDECSEEELCCSNGCGHVCTQGVVPTPLCSHLRDQILNSSLIGAFVPQCEEDGTFSSVQCHASTGYCWCVAGETGEPVSDMVRFRHPQCNENGDTDASDSDSDSNDEGDSDSNDEESSDSDGDGYFHSCPATRAGEGTICEAECQLHSECPSHLKCCYNGCGHSCVQPHRIPFIDISSSSSSSSPSCPDTSEVPCAETRGSCREEEFRCEGDGLMCCDNDCASAVCISSTDTPCFTAVEIAASTNISGMYGGYKPQCTVQGQFREIQCHAHYCWCVEATTGVPSSDIVPFEMANVLSCAACVYNGVKYSHLERFPSGVDCNTCTCVGGTISCSLVECNADDEDDAEGEIWEWWHSVLISCVVVVVVLVSVVLALLIGIVILMKQNAHRHHHLKELNSDECELIEYRNGHESVELKVPMEDGIDGNEGPVGTTKA